MESRCCFDSERHSRAPQRGGSAAAGERRETSASLDCWRCVSRWRTVFQDPDSINIFIHDIDSDIVLVA